ncbi:MAG: hypothetical protein LW855_03285 [Alphaproteobacteria bacterium]|jgi:hypothetical protein|nr:hypothetical protein [Alphaproteobacteria bacterium]
MRLSIAPLFSLILGLLPFVFALKTPGYAAEQDPCAARYNTRTALTLSPLWPTPDWQIVNAPKNNENLGLSADGKRLTVQYPAGSLNPRNTNAPPGGLEFLALVGMPADATAACLGYDVMVPLGFQFGKGGKLPGLYGVKTSNPAAWPASGCRSGAENQGFSARYMWREGGAGAVYVYVPGRQENCGTYYGKGSFTLVPGQTQRLTQEIRLNTPGKADGVLNVWVDGELVFTEQAFIWRETGDIMLRGLFFSTFFGGKSPDWASPQTQSLEFGGFAVYYDN